MRTERFYEEFYAALKASNDKHDRAKVTTPCPICGTSEPHGLHYLRRDGSIEPFDYEADQ